MIKIMSKDLMSFYNYSPCVKKEENIKEISRK